MEISIGNNENYNDIIKWSGERIKVLEENIVDHNLKIKEFGIYPQG